MSNQLTIKGRAGSDPELRFTPQGEAVASFSVADTPRKYNQQSGQWEDAGPILWQRVQVWGEEAEQANEQVRRGSLVTVVGKLRAEQWTDKNTGQERTSTSLVAEVVYVHPQRPRSDQTDSQRGNVGHQQGQGRSQDPWGGASEEPPF